MANRRSIWNVLTTGTEFKLAQIGHLVAFVSLYVATSSCVLAVFYVQLVHPNLVGDGLLPAMGDLVAIWRDLPDLRKLLSVWAAGMFGLSTFFAVALGLHLGHTVAGPIHRLESELLRLAEGAPVRTVTLREGDAFQGVAEALNRALATLQSGSASLEARAHELERMDEIHAALRGRLDGFPRERLCQADGARVSSLLEGLHELLAKAEAEESTPLAAEPPAVT